MAEILSTLSANADKGTPTNGGGRYSTLAAWQTAQAGDLTSDTHVLEVYNDFPSQELVETFDLTGWTNASTSNVDQIIIRPAAGQGHAGVVGDGFILRWDGNWNPTFEAMSTACTVRGFTIAMNGQGNGCITKACTMRVDQMIITTTYQTPSGSIDSNAYLVGTRSDGGSTMELWNTLVIGRGVASAQDYRPVHCKNVGITGAHYGFLNHASSTRENCWTHDIYTGPEYQGTSANNSLDHGINASEDGSATGSAPIVITAADFVDPGNNNFMPAPGGNLAGAGETLAEFGYDIVGTIRG